MKFDEHISNICLKANRKLSALSRLSRFISLEKRHTLFKAFIESQFKYCPRVWAFHGRQTNHKINRLHERALRIVYNDYGSSFQDLLSKYNLFTVHHQNLQYLAIEIYKTLNNLPGGTFEGISTLRTDSYFLRSEQELIIPKVSTVLKGKSSLRYFWCHYMEFNSK